MRLEEIDLIVRMNCLYSFKDKLYSGTLKCFDLQYNYYFKKSTKTDYTYKHYNPELEKV